MNDSICNFIPLAAMQRNKGTATEIEIWLFGKKSFPATYVPKKSFFFIKVHNIKVPNICNLEGLWKLLGLDQCCCRVNAKFGTIKYLIQIFVSNNIHFKVKFRFHCNIASLAVCTEANFLSIYFSVSRYLLCHNIYQAIPTVKENNIIP